MNDKQMEQMTAANWVDFFSSKRRDLLCFSPQEEDSFVCDNACLLLYDGHLRPDKPNNICLKMQRDPALNQWHIVRSDGRKRNVRFRLSCEDRKNIEYCLSCNLSMYLAHVDKMGGLVDVASSLRPIMGTFDGEKRFLHAGFSRDSRWVFVDFEAFDQGAVPCFVNELSSFDASQMPGHVHFFRVMMPRVRSFDTKRRYLLMPRPETPKEQENMESMLPKYEQDWERLPPLHLKIARRPVMYCRADEKAASAAGAPPEAPKCFFACAKLPAPSGGAAWMLRISSAMMPRLRSQAQMNDTVMDILRKLKQHEIYRMDEAFSYVNCARDLSLIPRNFLRNRCFLKSLLDAVPKKEAATRLRLLADMAALFLEETKDAGCFDWVIENAQRESTKQEAEQSFSYFVHSALAGTKIYEEEETGVNAFIGRRLRVASLALGWMGNQKSKDVEKQICRALLKFSCRIYHRDACIIEHIRNLLHRIPAEALLNIKNDADAWKELNKVPIIQEGIDNVIRNRLAGSVFGELVKGAPQASGNAHPPQENAITRAREHLRI